MTSELHERIVNAFTATNRKNSKYDSYFKAYAQILGPFLAQKERSNSPIKLLEIGVQDGGSLEAWKSILGSKSQIYGLDLNPECAKLSCDDYKVFSGDQSDPSVWNKMINEIGKFDIIIDDGSHVGFSQSKTIDYSLMGAIGQEGVVIIEDTHTAYMDKFTGDGVGINFMDKVMDLASRINSRSARLQNDPSSKLSHIKGNDIARTSIESIRIFESIVAIYIIRGLSNSRGAGSLGVTKNSIVKDVRSESKLYL